MNVIVLAGEKKDNNTNSLSDQTPREEKLNKALYIIKNKFMIEYVIETLKKSEFIDKIAVVGPKDKLAPVIGHMVDYMVEGTDSIVSNIILALEFFPGETEVLIVTSDIPMITVEAIEDFIERARLQNVDLCYSIIDKKVNDEKYPGVRRTYARLWEGQFTGGNVFYFNPIIKDKCKDFVEKMLEYRKSPAKMAGILGFGFLIRLALGILTINAIQKKCEKLLGIKGAAVISPYPEIGNDVDRLSDLEVIEKYIS
ncbi:MAG: NTP transferase domain-containing protein [Caulobacteraceae bacterium]